MNHSHTNSSLNADHLTFAGDSGVWASSQFDELGRIPISLLVLVAAFFVVAPLSISTVPFVIELKYARFGILALAGLVTLRNCPRLGTLGKAWVLLGIVFAVSSLWSSAIFTAFGYKSMFLGMVLGGICLGNTAVNLSGMIALAKATVSAGAILFVGTALAVQQGVVEPISWFNDRMSILGLNSNFIGVFASAYLSAAVAVFFFSSSQVWKFFCFVACMMFFTAVIYSGSRLALLVSLSTTSLIFFTSQVKHRKILLYVSVLMIIGASFAFVIFPQDISSPNEVLYEGSPDGGPRLRALSELTKDTRSGHWKLAIESWGRAPIFGLGWNNYGNRWGMVHSAYLQVLVECGVLGALVWAWVLWCCFTQCRLVYLNRRLLNDREITAAELGIAIVVVCLIHAVGESALLAATMPFAVALGVAVQMIDQATTKISEFGFHKHGFEFEDRPESLHDDASASQLG